MSTSTGLSDYLRRVERGKAYHFELQEDFKATSEGVVTAERVCRLLSGKIGRIDIHVQVDDEMVAVVEFKKTDWDRMAPHRVRPNVRRHIRQVWRYIEALLEEGMEVCPSLVYSTPPTNAKHRELIETLCADECLTVVFADE